MTTNQKKFLCLLVGFVIGLMILDVCCSLAKIKREGGNRGSAFYYSAILDTGQPAYTNAFGSELIYDSSSQAWVFTNTTTNKTP